LSADEDADADADAGAEADTEAEPEAEAGAGAEAEAEVVVGSAGSTSALYLECAAAPFSASQCMRCERICSSIFTPDSRCIRVMCRLWYPLALGCDT
jgi:hypothetical protein